MPILPRTASPASDTRPILLIPYMWVGDFVRGHSVVRVLTERFPHRPVDMLTVPLTAPLVDYMPGVRRAVVSKLPRSRIALALQRELADELRDAGYGTVLVQPRTWKSALAPFLAGIPERTGFFGEARFGLLNDIRWGYSKLPRFIDTCAALALPPGAPLPPDWPEPQLHIPAAEVAMWRAQNGLAPDGRPAVALAPGAVGSAKRWPAERYGALARAVADLGCDVWVLGGPSERPLAAEIATASDGAARDLTGGDLRHAAFALAAAQVAVSNDSGLLHVAAAIGTPTIGIFGPTSAWHYAPLNPLAAVIEAATPPPCRPCHKPVCRFGHHDCMRGIPPAQVLAAVSRTLGVAAAPQPAAAI